MLQFRTPGFKNKGVLFHAESDVLVHCSVHTVRYLYQVHTACRVLENDIVNQSLLQRPFHTSFPVEIEWTGIGGNARDRLQ